jgi:tetratricopeptide (TPR) repeat protein
VGLRLFLYGGAAGLALLGLVTAGLQIVGHDDLWWDLAAGRWILEHGEIPTTDVFTHTFAGKPWINLEWLSQVLFYAVYRFLGEGWILALRLGMIFLIFGVALAQCRERSRSWLISLAAVAFGAWVCVPFLDARPQLFTFLNALLLLWILRLYRRGERNLLGLVPLLIFLWTQLHGGYVFGLLLVAGNLAAETGKRLLRLPADPLPWPGIRRLAVTTVASALAILLNPWGAQAYTHPFSMSKLAGSSSLYLTVTEWLPPRPFAGGVFNPDAFWWFLILTAAVTLPIAAVRWRCFDLNDAGLAVVLAAVFALPHRRFIPLFVLLTLPWLSWALRFWADWWAHGRRAPQWRPGTPLPAAARARLDKPALAAAAASWLLLALLAPPRLLGLGASYGGGGLFRTNIEYGFFPERAAEFLRQAGVTGRMFNLYNWGGYLEFFAPGHPTFIDGRAQMVFPDTFYRDYLRVHFAEEGWREILDRTGVTYALIHTERNRALLAALDRDPEWRWVFADGTSALWLRRVPENRELLERWRWRELPLPKTAMTRFLYGRAAYAAGDFEQAVEDFGEAAERAPLDGEMRAHYIVALVAAGRLEPARREAEWARRELPDSVAVHLAAARVEEEAGRPEEAFRLFEEIFQRWPGEEQALEGLLRLDPDRGRAVLERAYRERPQAPWMSYARGRLAEELGSLDEARRLYQAEGAAAARAGDRERLMAAKRAFDRLPEGAGEGE